MRLKNSMYNVTSNFIVFAVKTILVFLSRNVFIQQLPQEIVGINGLFTNILSVLSLAELGIGSAIGFSLYKPLAEKDDKKTSMLMSFYKRAYMIIGTIIFGIGILIIPILPSLVDVEVKNMTIIFILFLLNTCFTYFISYKEVLIISDQKNYKLTKINLVFTVLVNVLEIITLLLTSNFILYLIVQFSITLVQRTIINIYISKQYTNVNFKVKDKLDDETKKPIFKNIKAMIYHKIGDCMVNSTDNIIISGIIGVNTVGIYSNYLLITSYLTSFASMIYNGILASLGNFIVSENQERKHDIFRKTNFLGMMLFSYFSILLLNIFNPAIEILANETYVLPFTTVVLIVINFYMVGIRVPASNMKIAAGMFDVDKYTPLIQSSINIVSSIILGRYMGLNGVLIGTFLSALLPTIQRPYIVYKYVLKKPVKGLLGEYLRRLGFVIILSIITIVINNIIKLDSSWLVLIQRTIVTTIIYIISFLFIYRKNEEFIYYKDLVKNLIRRKQNG